MTIKDETYNGWTNRETWLVNVWNIFEGFEDEFTEHAISGADDYNKALDLLAEQLEYTFDEFVEEGVFGEAPAAGSSIMTDFINDAISRIDWHEIAGHMLTDHIADYGDPWAVDDDDEDNPTYAEGIDRTRY